MLFVGLVLLVSNALAHYLPPPGVPGPFGPHPPRFSFPQYQPDPRLQYSTYDIGGAPYSGSDPVEFSVHNLNPPQPLVDKYKKVREELSSLRSVNNNVIIRAKDPEVPETLAENTVFIEEDGECLKQEDVERNQPYSCLKGGVKTGRSLCCKGYECKCGSAGLSIKDIGDSSCMCQLKLDKRKILDSKV